MGGGIISSLLKLFKVSFIEYLDYYINAIAVLSFLFAIFTFIFTLILSIYDLTNIIKTNLHLIIVIGIVLIIIVLIHYYFWYKNNFNKVTINKKALLIIEGRDEKNLSMEISKLIIPSEDLMILTLIIEFGEFIKDELLNKTYALLIKKPETLDIRFMNNTKSKRNIIDNEFDGSFYCINLKYTGNSIVKLLFELKADETTYGDFIIYFLEEDTTKKFENIIEYYDKLTVPPDKLFKKEQEKKEKLFKHFEEITSKKSYLDKETVCSKDIEINKGNYIIIDKKKSE